MLTFYDSQNQPLTLGERLGGGGEGIVYLCRNSSFVAKIYQEQITSEKAEKLRWMAAHADEQLLKVAAWVIDVLHDKPNGKIVGFLMPSVRAKEIHELYSLKSRRVYFPEATWFFLIHTAANVARAFYRLHKNGHIMGDVNHGNCVVLADGTVKLIDCDSYSIQTEKMRYPCEVGVGTHLAPELHGAELSKIERQFKHDNFGLAVIIFQLLFLGRHPFAGNYLGAEDKSIEECIRERRFAYGAGARGRNVKQPPGTLALEAVSPRVAELFERAFLTENRPEPREWIEALEDLSDNLDQCRLHPGHVFYKNLALCPWCEIESQTGVMLFPFVMSGIGAGHSGREFDIATIENIVASFDVKENLKGKLTDYISRAAKQLKPEPEIVAKNRQTFGEQAVIVLLFTSFYFWLSFSNYVCAFVCGIAATVIVHTHTRFGNLGKEIRQDAREKLEKARQKWNVVEDEWARLIAASNTQKTLVEIREKIADYSALKEKKIALVETVESSAMVEQATENRASLEKEIGDLLSVLRAGSLRLSKFVRQVQTQSKPLIQELAQAERNVKYLGSNFPLTIIIGLVTIVAPIINVTFFHSSKPATVVVENNSAGNKSNNNSGLYNRGNSAGNGAGTGTGSGIGNGIGAPKMNVFVPEENITNREIEKLSVSERKDIAAEIIRLADLAIVNKNFDVAEQKLKFAQRFDNKNARLFFEFGSLFYELENYRKSVEYLNRSVALEETEDADFYLGMNYIRLEKYAAARDIFLKLINGEMKNNAVFYNLGIAQQQLKNYSAAIAAYQNTLRIEPNDLDATYEMGICYSKLKDVEQVKRFYFALREKNPKRAAEFKDEVGTYFDLDSPPPVSAAN